MTLRTRISIARLAALTFATVCGIAGLCAVAARPANADTLPFHSAPGVVSCEAYQGHLFFTSPMPTMYTRPETQTSVSGGTFTLGDYSGVTTGGLYTPAYDEWLMYQIAVYWYDGTAWQHKYGIADASLNSHVAGAPTWMYIDNRWQYVVGGWIDGGSPGNSTVEAPYSKGPFWILATMVWEPFGNYGSLTSSVWLGPYTCSNVSS